MSAVRSEPVHVACPACAGINRVPADKLRDQPKCGRCHNALFTAHPVALTAENFDAHVGRSDLPVVVDFWASWCGPCRAMAPVFEQAAGELEPNARLAKVNTEESQNVAARFGIRSIPTLILFKQGREIARQSGAMPLPLLLAWVRSAL